MVVYLILLLSSALVPFAVYRTSGIISGRTYEALVLKRNKLTVEIFFVGLFVLLALRDFSVGNDLGEYRLIFERCIYLPFERLSGLGWETGYTIYNKLVSFLTNDYRLFLAITAMITLIPIYKLYVNESRYNILHEMFIRNLLIVQVFIPFVFIPPKTDKADSIQTKFKHEKAILLKTRV
jgi:hypothetical protein